MKTNLTAILERVATESNVFKNTITLSETEIELHIKYMPKDLELKQSLLLSELAVARLEQTIMIINIIKSMQEDLLKHASKYNLNKESYMNDKREQVKKLLKNKSLNMRQMQRLTGLNEQQLKEAIEDVKAS